MKRMLITQDVMSDGTPIRVYRHPHVGYQIYVGGWRVATRKTLDGARRVLNRHKEGLAA